MLFPATSMGEFLIERFVFVTASIRNCETWPSYIWRPESIVPTSIRNPEIKPGNNGKVKEF